MIFPEGTRSKTGELRDFHAGAFKLAIDAQVPILPLAVWGTRDALRKNDWRLGYAKAEVRVLDPVDTEGMTVADLDTLRSKVRDMIAAARDDLQREFAAATADRSVDAGQHPQRAGRRCQREPARFERWHEDLLVRRTSTVGRVGEHVVDRQRATHRHVWRPAFVVEPCRLLTVTAVDEQERQRRGPASATSGERPTTATTECSRSASWIAARKNGSVSISPVRGSTTSRSWCSHPAWFSSEPRW